MIATVITGSGHFGSRCQKVGEMVAEKLRQNDIQTQLLEMVTLDVKECLGCEYCLSHQNQCIIQDQMQEIYPILDETDILVFVSPVYFSNFPAELKKLIDRCQLYFNLKNKDGVKPKKFLAIHIGGAPAYSGQFEAFHQTYRVLLPDLKAELVEFIEITGSDKADPLANENILSRLDNGVCKLISTGRV